MAVSEKQLEAIQEKGVDNIEEDIEQVEVEELENTPMDVYHNILPTGYVFVLDGDDLVYWTSKVMNRNAKSEAISHARMYAFGAGYREEY